MVDGLGNTCKSDTISSLRNPLGSGLTNGEVKQKSFLFWTFADFSFCKYWGSSLFPNLSDLGGIPSRGHEPSGWLFLMELG